MSDNKKKSNFYSLVRKNARLDWIAINTAENDLILHCITAAEQKLKISFSREKNVILGFICKSGALKHPEYVF